MTIIGIDPAYAKPCAYAIFDDSDFQECGTFAPERLIATLEYLVAPFAGAWIETVLFEMNLN